MSFETPDAYVIRSVRVKGNVRWVTEYGRFARLKSALTNAAAISRLIPADYIVQVTPQKVRAGFHGRPYWDDIGEATHTAAGTLESLP